MGDEPDYMSADNLYEGRVYIGKVTPDGVRLGVDLATASATAWDGQVYQFLGFTNDDGLVFGDPVESWYIDPGGNRVDVPATIEPWPAPPLLVTSFTMPFRHADRMPVLHDARPRCPKCSTVLDPCDQCGGPAQCGDAFCAEHQPD